MFDMNRLKGFAVDRPDGHTFRLIKDSHGVRIAYGPRMVFVTQARNDLVRWFATLEGALKFIRSAGFNLETSEIGIHVSNDDDA